MLEKPKRAKQLNNQDRQLPATIQELINRYDLENKDIYKFLDYLVDNINNKTSTGEGSVSGDTLPIGAIVEWNSDIIPENWLLCNGQAVNREEYSELFEVLGITYGKGDGRTTFNLPNYKGKVAIGKDENDTDFNTLGKTSGEKEHKLTFGEMPRHAHKTWIADNNYTEKGDGYEYYYYGSGHNYNLTTFEGGDQPHNNLQPYIVSNFIIKAKQSAGLVATIVDGLKSNSPTNALSANQGRVLNEIKQDKNFIKSFQLKEDTGDFRIDGLDIIKDGGTYEVEMYLQHSKARDFAIGIQINNLDDAKWVYQGLDCLNDGNPARITSYNTTPNHGRLGAIRYNYTTIIKFTIHKADYSFGGALRYYIDSICMNGNFVEHTISQYQPASLDVNLTSIRIMNKTNTEVFQSGSYVKIYKK